MKTIDITLASPEVALAVERALEIAAARGEILTDAERAAARDVSQAITAARLRVEFRNAGERFFRAPAHPATCDCDFCPNGPDGGAS